MSAPRYATTGERVTAKLVTLAWLVSGAAALGIALIAGVFIGITIGIAPQPPEVIRVVVQPEPVAVDAKAQADAEIEAYNRGLEAGKFIGCNPAAIERNER